MVDKVDDAVEETLSEESVDTTPMEIVKKNMLWSGGAGLLPIPLVEFVAVSGLQIKLIKELSDHYGVPFRQDLAKSIVFSLVGSLGGMKLAQVLATSSLRAIPVVGPVISALSLPAMSAGVAYAIGKVFIAHYETGGTLLTFDAEKMKSHFKSFYEEGVKKAGALKDKMKSSKAQPSKAAAAT
ncbi:YcjF family protein [Kordiimonas pumila]|uniref:YcjF family protein n=1 Tax=Kordiimonas pumila TaxID=2161677 RepID=A0ABV7D4A8_9PROT|nr:DUF697 domain-containing protein [Kordiimonas pumila]